MNSRRIWGRLVVASIGACVGVGSLAGAASAATTTECRGTIGAETISGKLVVPEGASCELDGTTIDGGVLVERGGSLITKYGSTVNIARSVRAIGARFLQLEAEGVIGGEVLSQETAEETILQRGTVDHQVRILSPGTSGAEILEETGMGQLAIVGGQNVDRLSVRGSSFARGARINHNVFSEGAALNDQGLEVEGSTMSEGLSIVDNEDVLLSVDGNNVKGSAKINANLLAAGRYRSEVWENTIENRLACIGDTPESQFYAYRNTAANKVGECRE